MPINEEPTVWETAQRKCWTHVEVATNVTRLLDALKHIEVLSVIPILSDMNPTILITPDKSDSLEEMRRVIKSIADAVQTTSRWLTIPINDEWVFRLVTPSNITIDVMTQLPAKVANTIQL